MKPRAAVILSSLLVVAALLSGLACDDKAERGSEGEIISEGSLDVFTLKRGDCFQDDEAAAELDGVSEVPAVPCSEPHDNEIYHIFFVADTYRDWPGEAEIDAIADEGCYAAFEPFVGHDYETSRLDFGWFVPTEESWDAYDDREIDCFVYDVDLKPLTGSMRNSGE
jgi:hypothetical protein